MQITPSRIRLLPISFLCLALSSGCGDSTSAANTHDTASSRAGDTSGSTDTSGPSADSAPGLDSSSGNTDTAGFAWRSQRFGLGGAVPQGGQQCAT